MLVNDQVDPTTEEGVSADSRTDRRHRSTSSVVDSRFIGNGYSVSDRDGLRVNEGGDGDLSFTRRSDRAERQRRRRHRDR